jgi:hypothetical protein
MPREWTGGWAVGRTRESASVASVQKAVLTGALQGCLLGPAERGEIGVVVLGGSSGRGDVARAKLFAE